MMQNNPFIPSFYYPQAQQPQLQPQQMSIASLNGHTISNVSEVTPNDVPMNGNFAYFPKADNTEIVAKRWNANGCIDTLVYKPVQAFEPSTTDISPQGELESLVEAINKRFDKLEELLPSTAKKRVKNDTADNTNGNE